VKGRVLDGNLVVVVLLCLISSEPGVRVVEVEHHAVLGRASQRAASCAHRAAAQGFRCRAGCSRRTQRARCADSAAPTSAQRDAVTHSLRSFVIAQLIGAALFDDDSVHATGKVSGCVWDQGEEESRRLAFRALHRARRRLDEHFPFWQASCLRFAIFACPRTNGR